jgi:putative MATE family efflux protein
LRDLTSGGVAGKVLLLAGPIAAGLLAHMLHQLVDLYFVASLGPHAVAGVSAAANLVLVTMTLSNALGVGTMTVVSHSIGRQDHGDASSVFNQSVVIATLLGVLTLVAAYLGAGLYMRWVVGAAPAIQAGTIYIHWLAPGLSVQFVLIAMSSALQGAGVVTPTMLVQLLTVIMNILLVPLLISGVGGIPPLGVAGAGLATSLSIAAGALMLWGYLARRERWLRVHLLLCKPQMPVWLRIIRIGLPTSGELVIVFLIVSMVYWALRGFGSDVQAGFGVGSRVLQVLVVPALAIALAAVPLAGQSFGAGKLRRVRSVFFASALIGSTLSAALTLLCQWQPQHPILPFTSDPAVAAAGLTFLTVASWNLVPQAIILSCASIFRAFGNTLPSLLSGSSRLLTFCVPVIWLSSRSPLSPETIWEISVWTICLEAVLALAFLRTAFHRAQDMQLNGRHGRADRGCTAVDVNRRATPPPRACE